MYVGRGSAYREEIREASVVGGRVMLAAGGESDSVRCQGDIRIRTPPRDGMGVRYRTIQYTVECTAWSCPKRVFQAANQPYLDDKIAAVDEVPLTPVRSDGMAERGFGQRVKHLLRC
jgi:hypothetical protein